MLTIRLIKFLQKNTEKIFKPVTRVTPLFPTKEFLKIREDKIKNFIRESSKNPERYFGC